MDVATDAGDLYFVRRGFRYSSVHADLHHHYGVESVSTQARRQSSPGE